MGTTTGLEGYVIEAGGARRVHPVPPHGTPLVEVLGGRTPAPAAPYRSKTEARYADLLKTRLACEDILAFWYEPMSLRLGHQCHYTPDFLVQRPGTALLEFVEIKGSFIRDRSLVKPRAAATRFPCYVF